MAKQYFAYVGKSFEWELRYYPPEPHQCTRRYGVPIIDVGQLTDQQYETLREAFYAHTNQTSVALNLVCFDDLPLAQQVRVKAMVPSFDELPDDFPVCAALRRIHKAACLLRKAVVPERDVVPEQNVAPPIFIAASGNGVPTSALEAYNESIEWADEPANVRDKKLDEVVSVLNEIKERMPTEQTVFSSTYRALAKHQRPEHETDIETVDRLYKEGIAWKNIIHQVYYPDYNTPDDIPEIDSEVKRVQGQHRTAFPESYPKRKQ